MPAVTTRSKQWALRLPNELSAALDTEHEQAERRARMPISKTATLIAILRDGLQYRRQSARK